MSTPDQNQTPVESGEQLFLRNALASVERAARVQRIKRIVLSVIIFPVVYYLMESPREHPTFTVIGVLGLMLALGTVKILAQLTSNTRTILQAIAELSQK
jgi:hypothetical protein